jgi:hypothetical protein
MHQSMPETMAHEQSMYMTKTGTHRTRMHAATVAVSALTLALDAQKAMWNRYALLVLIHYKFTLPQIGADKFWSILVKLVFQVAVPALDDSGVLQRCLPAQTSAHVLSVAAALAGVPTVFAFERACASGDLGAVVAVKSAASVLSCLLGLADGIVTRTVQVQRRPYAHTQVTHAFAWAFAVFGGGVVVDVFGMSGIFYALSVLKLVAVLCLVVMAMRWPLHRKTDTSSATSMCSVAAYVWGAPQVKRLACLCALWGLCFVLVETFTITQMDTELGFSKSASGFASMLAVLSGVPVYLRAPEIIASHGHRWLFAFGVCTATVFAAAQSFVHVDTAALAVVLCPLRGVAYAAIWAALMDMLVRDVKNEFLASVQVLVVFAWFTLGNGLGYLFWAHVYEQLRGPRCYALCAGVLALSLGLVPGPRPRARFLPTIFFVVVAAVSWRVAHTIWLQAPGDDKLDSGQYARVLAGAIHTKLDGKVHTPSTQAWGNINTLDERYTPLVLQQQDNAHTPSTPPRSNNTTNNERYAPLMVQEPDNIHRPVAPGNGSHLVPRLPVLNAAQDRTLPLKHTHTHTHTQNKHTSVALHEYVQRRIARTDPRQYARFADRL